MKEAETASEAFRRGADRAELALLNHPRLTDPQTEFSSATDRFLLWVGGNSIGKSWGHAFDLVHFARGSHPFRQVPRGERKLMVAGFSFSQMDPLMEKLWAMLPKGEIHPKLYYAVGQGIKGFKEPIIPFVRGPGRGSAIYLATYQQGADRIMGFQGHRLSFDEPPPSEVYNEGRPRLNRYRGEMRITMTPTMESPPLEYLKQEVEDGKVRMMKTSYNERNITIRGGLVPWAWKRQRDIDEDIAGYSADERPMREHGDWDPVLAGRRLERVTEACFIDGHFSVPAGWVLAVGMDHGARPGRQWATLVAMNPATGDTVILDEGREPKVTTIDEDAVHIIAMLERNGIRWTEVDYWVGDRATSESYWGDAKSNLDMQRALAAHLRLTSREAAAQGLRIQTMVKGRGSLRRGISMINTLAGRGQLRVRRSCAGFIKGVKEWTGDPQSELKDPLDSARYAIMTMYDGQQVRASHGPSGYVGG